MSKRQTEQEEENWSRRTLKICRDVLLDGQQYDAMYRDACEEESRKKVLYMETTGFRYNWWEKKKTEWTNYLSFLSNLATIMTM